MWFLSLLMPLTLFGVLHSIKFTVRNKCDYDVWFIELLLKVGTLPHVEIPHKVDRNSSLEVERNALVKQYMIRADCNWLSINCNSGGIRSPCPCPKTGCCLRKEPIENNITINLASLLGGNDTYLISNLFGYNIPIQISVTGAGAPHCETILCNVTLDDCPDNENYGIGDLRLMSENRTVGCVSPCTKLSYPAETGIDQDRNACMETNYPYLKYVELLNRKCPSNALRKVFDEAVVEGKCTWDSSNHTAPHIEIVSCP